MSSDEQRRIFAQNLTTLMDVKRLKDADLSSSLTKFAKESQEENFTISARAISDLRKGNSFPRSRTLRNLERFFARSDLLEKEIDPNEYVRKHGHAFDDLGGYSFDKNRSLIGEYLCFRNSFDYDDGVVCSHLKIEEDRAQGSFVFFDHQENISRENVVHKYKHKGLVSILEREKVIQLRAMDGALRRVVNFKIANENLLMGVLQTLGHDAMIGFFPTVTSCVAFKLSQEEKNEKLKTWKGSKRKQDLEQDMPEVLARLNQVQQHYVK